MLDIARIIRYSIIEEAPALALAGLPKLRLALL
jgi:hypothetical protein